jgi:hypothetical protein
MSSLVERPWTSQSLGAIICIELFWNIDWISFPVILHFSSLYRKPGPGCSNQCKHDLGVKSVLALNQLDLTEWFNAKIN